VDPERLARFGLTQMDYQVNADTQYGVLPCNWASVMLFIDLTTQWRVGVNGATGIDYAVIPHVLSMRRVRRALWPELFDDVREMEREVLDVFAARSTAVNEED